MWHEKPTEHCVLRVADEEKKVVVVRVVRVVLSLFFFSFLKLTASLLNVSSRKITSSLSKCDATFRVPQQHTVAALAKLATQTDGLKLLLVVQDRPALEGRAGLLPGGFPSCIYTHSDQPECLRKIQVEIFNSCVVMFLSRRFFERRRFRRPSTRRTSLEEYTFLFVFC